MKAPRPAARRVFGTLFLTIALMQIVLGLTLLKDQLGAVGTVLYWTGCLLATFGAVVCALLDATHNLRESRRERRTLLEDTLREIDEERARQRDQEK